MIDIIIIGVILSCYCHLSQGHSSGNKLILASPGNRWLSARQGMIRVCLGFDFAMEILSMERSASQSAKAGTCVRTRR